MTTHDMATNVTMIIIARIAMLLTPLIMSGGIYIVNDKFQELTAQAVADRQRLNETVIQVAKLETRIDIGHSERLEFMTKADKRLDDLGKKIDEQTERISLLATSVGALTAIFEDRKGPGK